mmetsp:Transcript_47785/g.64798  ORF Transcript_47785/g.64798 Transcript_47785/m.64798 type:complete len:286 (-) Transcript_47785:1639-2496(-)
MFDADDIDERGEIPAPFCVEKHNFNPHDLQGNFDHDENGKPIILKNSRGDLVDKKGRRVNKKGWLVYNANLVDRHGRKKFDRRQLVDQDLPKLFNYSGRRYDIKDIMGLFDKDITGNILPIRAPDGDYLIDNNGNRVNEKGYLVDPQGNIIDKEGKKLFDAKHLKNGEPPKIFPFTKFNIKNVLGDFEMDPLGNPILDKDDQGNLIDGRGRRVNPKGYLIDNDGNIIDRRGKHMFDKDIIDSEGEIPKVFRTGLLKSDTASSLSRLMSEIERNHASEFDQQEQDL